GNFLYFSLRMSLEFKEHATSLLRPALSRSVCVVLATLSLLATRVWGNEEPTQREYELKAAVLYHIIEYVEWPSEALSGQSGTLQLGLIGDIPFAGAIE